MSIFISFNHSTGSELAQIVSKELKSINLDPWWFPDPLSEEQVDSMVGNALANCSRCIFLWTQKPSSNWTFAELVSIRNYFRNRLPSGEATEAFVIIRDLSKGIKKTDTLPLFSDCQYINYTSGEKLNLDFLETDMPGVVPLFAGKFKHPKLVSLDPKFVNIGKRILHGEIIKPIIPLPFEKRYCWIFIEDTYGNRYIQQPRPTFTHRKRWGSAVINLGTDIISIILAALDEEAHTYVVNCVLKQSFAGKPITDWPGDYFELDRIDFSPLK